ncbi:MAG: FecR family protein [Bacteroidales bacterium]
MKIDYQIIKRYLENQETKADKDKIITWFNTPEAEKELKERSRIYWDTLVRKEHENFNESVILGRIYREIQLKKAGEQSKPYLQITKIVNLFSKVAAVLFIPLLIFLFIENDIIKGRQTDLTYMEIHSPVGTRTKFYLPDGSTGWLNGGGSLKYPSDFHGNTRNVNLIGEAYFDIKTNPKKPFEVSGGDLKIIAKGTAFNVAAWHDESEIIIALTEGKIEIVRKDNERSLAGLKPGQLLHYNSEKERSYVKNVDVKKYISWIEGKLIFRDDPLGEVVRRLNRWYNVNIIIKDDTLHKYEYVATFEDENLDEVLKMLALSGPIKYKEIPRNQFPDGKFQKRTIELYYKN